jgi:hypothetical protein
MENLALYLAIFGAVLGLFATVVSIMYLAEDDDVAAAAGAQGATGPAGPKGDAGADFTEARIDVTASDWTGASTDTYTIATPTAMLTRIFFTQTTTASQKTVNLPACLASKGKSLYLFANTGFDPTGGTDLQAVLTTVLSEEKIVHPGTAAGADTMDLGHATLTHAITLYSDGENWIVQ